ncbi:hypothetical protein VDGD_04135 [Verticillium dahliae]|nr:hypothetical protein VDGD_04135 [Verticillium dahliae]
MAPREKSQLKRLRGSLPDNETESKKPRRSERLSVNDPDKTPVSHKGHLPSPVTHTTEPDANDRHKSPTATPPEGRPSQVNPREETPVQANILSSPPQDTQAFSQYPPETKDSLSDDVEDEVKEGVWGYLFPLDTKYGRSLVMKKRTACPMPDTVADKVSDEDRKGKSPARKEEVAYEKTKIKGIASGGYLIGRHPECDIVIDDPIVSNRHCLLFIENKGGDTVAIVEDLSSNGTFVNEAIIGRNQRRELREQDEIAVLDKARFIFRYPKSRQTSPFHQSYTLLQKLGKGHFAEVFLCVEKSTGQQYAVKVFSKTPGMEERSKQEGLQQEIAVLMGVSHPNVLCLKDTFNERNAVYLVLELAPEGELFNFIVMKQKVSEDETRKLFKQLFQGIKYLVCTTPLRSRHQGITNESSMSGTLFIETLSLKTFSWWTRSSTSSLPTLVSPRLLVKSRLPRLSVAHLATSHQRSLPIRSKESTPRLSISGRLAWYCIFVCAASRHSQMSYFLRSSRTLFPSRSRADVSTIPRLTGTLSATQHSISLTRCWSSMSSAGSPSINACLTPG